MNREGTNCTDRIADSRRSRQSYLLPYSKLKKENSFDSLDSREDFNFCVRGTRSQNNGGWGGRIGPEERDKQMRNSDTDKTTTKRHKGRKKKKEKKAHEKTKQQKQQQRHMKKEKKRKKQTKQQQHQKKKKS